LVNSAEVAASAINRTAAALVNSRCAASGIVTRPVSSGPAIRNA